MAPIGHYSVTYLDYTNEDSTFGVHIAELNAGNCAAQGALIQALGDAVNDLSLGNPARSRLTAQTNTISSTPATDINAQVERKWRVFYVDDVNGREYTLEIPCAKLTGNLVTNKDDALLTSTEWAAFVTAFEAVAKSQDGNSVTVTSAIHVGKNL
jgi:hypothetical protein